MCACVCAHMYVGCPVRLTSLWHSFAHGQFMSCPPRTLPSLAHVHRFNSPTVVEFSSFPWSRCGFIDHRHRRHPAPSRKHCFSASSSSLYRLVCCICVHACKRRLLFRSQLPGPEQSHRNYINYNAAWPLKLTLAS